MTKTQISSKFEPFEFYGFGGEIEWDITNNGHTIKLTPKKQSMSVLGGGLPASYTVAQIHFHWSGDNVSFLLWK